MSECQFCRATQDQTSTFFVDRRLTTQREPPSQARLIAAPAALKELELCEVGPCCERAARAELSPIRASLLEIAAAPNTEAPWLLTLFNVYQSESDFREALIQNPNLPSLIAKLLAPLYFDAFLKNPALPLWCLEAPSFLQDVVALFLEKAETFKEDRWRFPWPVSWLQHLSGSANPKARCYAASHSQTPAETRWQLAKDPSPEVRGYLAYHADEALLLHLASDPDTDVRRQAARVGLHLSILARLACDPAYEVRSSVGVNQRLKIPSRMRRELREEPNTYGKYFK